MENPAAWIVSKVHIPIGLILLTLGTLTAINPDIMAYYGLPLADLEARVAIRAIIGGGEIGLGLALTFGRLIGATPRSLNLIAASVLLSVGLVRIAAAFFASEDLAFLQSFREGSVEVALGVLASIGCSKSRP